MAVPEFRMRLTLDEGDLKSALARADAANTAFLDRVGQQAAQAGQQVSRMGAAMGQAQGSIKGAAGSLGAATAATKLNRQEVLALNYTISDVAASLASGASPFTVLMQQGGQLKDSFGGLGQMASKLAAAITPAGVALTAVAAAVVALGAGYYQGHKEQEAFNKALLLTGNYAGLTNDSIASMSRGIADAVRGGVGDAREMLTELAATGRISAGAIEPVGKAAALFAQVSGQSAAQVAGHFATMSDGVARWAQEANKKYHFLGVAQIQYIQKLEEQGRTEQAMRVVSEALYTHLGGGAVKNLGTLERAWKGVGDAIDGAKESLKSIGRDETFAAQIAQARANLALAKQTKEQAINPGPLADLRVNKAQAALDELLKKQGEDKAAAEKAALTAKVQQEADAANKRIKQLADESKGQSLLNKQIKAYRDDIEAVRLGGGAVPSEAEQSAQIQRLREKFNPKGVQQANALGSAISERRSSFGQDGAKLDQQIAEFERFGRMVDATTRSVLEFDLARGKLRGASAEVAAELRAKADEIDQKKQQLAQAQAAERVDKRIEALKAAADAQALSNREQRVAQELAAIDEQLLPRGSALYEAKARAVREAVNADEDRLTVRRLAEQSLGTDGEIARLQQETQALAQNTLERQIAAYALQLEAQARKEVANSPGQEAAIRAAKGGDLARYVDAATDAYNRQRDAVIGAQQAIKKYAEDAANGAEHAGRFVAGSMVKIEDAIVSLAKTGKADLKGLFGFMAEEFLRQQARMMISNFSKSDGMLGLVTSIAAAFAGGASGSSAAGTAGKVDYRLVGGASSGQGSGLTMPKFADGGDPYVNRLNLVGERGMELFVPRVPGTIVPNHALGGLGAPSVQVVQHNQIGSTVGRTDLEAAMVAARQAAVAEVFDRLKRVGGVR